MGSTDEVSIFIVHKYLCLLVTSCLMFFCERNVLTQELTLYGMKKDDPHLCQSVV